MQDDAGKQTNLHNADNKIGGHKAAPVIKSLTAIIKKNHGINAAVNHQEDNQEKACKRHDKLFANRGGKKRFPGHKADIVF